MINPPPTDSNDRAFSSIDLVGQCLLDPEKVAGFRTAFVAVIRPDSVVLELGTGSGILALLAARAGARRVIAVEYDPYVAKIARQNIRNNNYDAVVEVRVADARDIQFGRHEHFDVVIAEMLTAGLIDECQVEAVNNIHRQGAVSTKTIFVPERQDIFVALADMNFGLHGFSMKMPLHGWPYFPHTKATILSESVLAKSVSFSTIADERCNLTIPVTATGSGMVNAIWLTSRAWVGRDTFLENTFSVNPPVAIPVADKAVREGERFTIRLAYRYGGGFQNLIVDVR